MHLQPLHTPPMHNRKKHSTRVPWRDMSLRWVACAKGMLIYTFCLDPVKGIVLLKVVGCGVISVIMLCVYIGLIILYVEFGTLPMIQVGQNVVMENYYHHHAATELEKQFSGEQLKFSFMVNTTKWKRNVVRRGITVLAQAISHLSLTDSALFSDGSSVCDDEFCEM